MEALQSAALPQPPQRHRLAAFVVWFLVVFNVLFPKGGFKIGDVPYTWGYLFLGATLVPLALIRFAACPPRMRRNTLLAILTIIPFQLLILYSFRTYGVGSFGFFATMIVSFFILPFAFLVVYPGLFPPNRRQEARRRAPLLHLRHCRVRYFSLLLLCPHRPAHRGPVLHRQCRRLRRYRADQAHRPADRSSNSSRPTTTAMSTASA